MDTEVVIRDFLAFKHVITILSIGKVILREVGTTQDDFVIKSVQFHVL